MTANSCVPTTESVPNMKAHPSSSKAASGKCADSRVDSAIDLLCGAALASGKRRAMEVFGIASDNSTGNEETNKRLRLIVDEAMEAIDALTKLDSPVSRVSCNGNLQQAKSAVSHKVTKEVSFASEEDIVPRAITHDDLYNTWYNALDYKLFCSERVNTIATWRMINYGVEPEEDLKAAFCMRGLESFQFPTRAINQRNNRNMYLRILFEEQSKQRQQDKKATLNFDGFNRRVAYASAFAQELAQQTARDDEREALQIHRGVNYVVPRSGSPAWSHPPCQQSILPPPPPRRRVSSPLSPPQQNICQTPVGRITQQTGPRALDRKRTAASPAAMNSYQLMAMNAQLLQIMSSTGDSKPTPMRKKSRSALDKASSKTRTNPTDKL